MAEMDLENIRIRDPFFLAEDGSLYLFGSTDKNTWDGPGSGFDMYSSQDGKIFSGPYSVFSPSKSFWGKENFWAPEIKKYNEKYYMTASFKGKKGRGVQILSSEQIEGPYEPIRNNPITPMGWECLDGTLYVENNILYLIFCREWIQVGDGQIWAAPLEGDLTCLAQEPMLLFSASESGWAVKHEERGRQGYVTDGPYLYPMKNNRLAMIWSSFSTYGYSLGVAYSDTGIRGPWRHEAVPLYKKDGGHGMIFRYGGNLTLAIHAPNIYGKERVKMITLIEQDGRLKLK